MLSEFLLKNVNLNTPHYNPLLMLYINTEKFQYNLPFKKGEVYHKHFLYTRH